MALLMNSANVILLQKGQGPRASETVTAAGIWQRIGQLQ